MNFPQPFQGCPMSVGEIDSVEVKAMLFGRVLVIDEFDKAPTEVVLTLKGLLHLGTEREIFEHDVNVSNHKEDMESMETLLYQRYMSWYAWGNPWASMIWQSGYVWQHLEWNHPACFHPKFRNRNEQLGFGHVRGWSVTSVKHTQHQFATSAAFDFLNKARWWDHFGGRPAFCQVSQCEMSLPTGSDDSSELSGWRLVEGRVEPRRR